MPADTALISNNMPHGYEEFPILFLIMSQIQLSMSFKSIEESSAFTPES